LEGFKESFDKALTKEGFAVASRDCTQTFLEQFDKGSEGMVSGMLSIHFLIVSLAYPNFLGTKRLCFDFFFFRKVMSPVS
jgi:hypothetical protein